MGQSVGVVTVLFVTGSIVRDQDKANQFDDLTLTVNIKLHFDSDHCLSLSIKMKRPSRSRSKMNRIPATRLTSSSSIEHLPFLNLGYFPFEQTVQTAVEKKVI